MKIEKYFAFAVIAVEKGFITLAQTKEALDIQVTEDVIGKKHRRLGEVLVSLGYMTDLQVNEVLKDM